MTDRTLTHRRTHNLLLIQKLLSLRDNASPFTLILDTVEQSGKPLVWQYVLNAKVRSPHKSSFQPNLFVAVADNTAVSVD